MGKVDLVQCWVDHKEAFPGLAALVLGILAIPAKAADGERAMGLAKFTLPFQRQPMDAETIEAIQLLETRLRARGVSLE